MPLQETQLVAGREVPEPDGLVQTRRDRDSIGFGEVERGDWGEVADEGLQKSIRRGGSALGECA